jgi:hypothetical protein
VGIRPVDPQIANKTRARKNRNLSNSSYTVPNLDGRTGAMGATKRGANVVDAGERDAPKFPPAFTGKGTSSSAALGSLEGLTGQYGGNTGSASRRAENKAAIAQLIADNKAKNALGDHMRQNPWAYGDRYRTSSTPGLDAAIDFGVAQRTPTSLGQGGPSMTDLESYAFDNPVATGSATSDTGSDDTTGGSVLDAIEADLMSGGRQFGDMRTLQNALVQLRGSLNANELQRSRRLEDFALMIDRYRRQADRMRRQIPGGFNRRGMLNSGQFDRGMGEFESQVIRDELEQRHKLQRALQDLGFSDRAAGHTFDETIRENAISDALASAAKASAISIPGLDGGFTPVGDNMMNKYGDAYMNSLIQSMFKD